MSVYEKPEIVILQIESIDIIATSGTVSSADIDDETTPFDDSWLGLLGK